MGYSTEKHKKNTEFTIDKLSISDENNIHVTDDIQFCSFILHNCFVLPSLSYISINHNNISVGVSCIIDFDLCAYRFYLYLQ